jgi:hypothetical protein
MRQPLITRPSYGRGRPATPVAVSGLPGGGPSDKGLPLDSGIPGTSTFDKPEGDIREQGKDDENIHRVDNADDLTKDRSRIDTREDNADKHDGIGEMGKGEWDTTIKTKYPYRDNRPNQHYAADPEFVAESFLLRGARVLVLRPDAQIKVAEVLEDLTRGLNPATVQRARKCAVSLKRADLRNLRWLFSVDCGNGAKVVRLKANRIGNIVRLTKMDLHLSCSCPAWRWQGPEFHGTQRDFQDPKTPLQGTASTPDIRDPDRHNIVCKHVAAALSFVRGWEIPIAKKK